MPLQKPKPYTPWTIAAIVAMFAAFAVLTLAATGVFGQTPQTPAKIEPECLAGGGCWAPKSDAPAERQDCLRPRTFDAAVYDPSVVFCSGGGPPS